MYKLLMTENTEDRKILAKSLAYAWDKLNKQAQRLGDAIESDWEYAAWIYGQDTSADSRQAAAQAVQQLLFLDGQDPKTTVKCPGILAASMNTLREAERLNVRKREFRRSLRYTEDKLATIEQRNSITKILEIAGLARINRMQIYRTIRVVAPSPDKVAFFWARTRRVQRISARALINKLEKTKFPRTKRPIGYQDIARLQSVPSEEIFALVEHLPAHTRANIWWMKSGGESVRRQMTVALPLLCLTSPGSPLMLIKPPDILDNTPHRVRRADRKLEDRPCLVTLSVYRYREKYRSYEGTTQPLN